MRRPLKPKLKLRPNRVKLEKDVKKIVKIPPKMQTRMGYDAKNKTMLIPQPLEVDALIRMVKRGRVVTQSELRNKLAQEAGADVTCPITTGIFIRIVAETAEEDLEFGEKKITPYWRVIRDDGSLLEKPPGGPAAQAKKLKAEGHKFQKKFRTKSGVKIPKLENFEPKLHRFK